MAQRGSVYDLHPGYPVFTRDGEALGQVKEIRGDAIKVDAPWQRDYWLPLDRVLSVIPGERVTVDASSEEIEDMEVDRPSMGSDEYRRRYRMNQYGAGMDFDPESERWRQGTGYGPYREYGRGGGAFDWEDEGGYRTRGEAYGRNRGDYADYPSRDWDREGQYEWARRRQFSDEGPGRRERTTQQWGQQYRGYAGDQQRGQRQWRYGRMSPTQGPMAYRQGVERRPGGSDARRYRGESEGRDYDYERGSGIYGNFGGVGGYGQGYMGKGPKGYQRNDDRVCEDVCEALTRHPDIDPSNIEVRVEGGEVVLSGTVETRYDKRIAEDIAADVAGVKDVRNELKAQTSMMTGADKPLQGTEAH